MIDVMLVSLSKLRNFTNSGHLKWKPLKTPDKTVSVQRTGMKTWVCVWLDDSGVRGGLLKQWFVLQSQLAWLWNIITHQVCWACQDRCEGRGGGAWVRMNVCNFSPRRELLRAAWSRRVAALWPELGKYLDMKLTLGHPDFQCQKLSQSERENKLW